MLGLVFDPKNNKWMQVYDLRPGPSDLIIRLDDTGLFQWGIGTIGACRFTYTMRACFDACIASVGRDFANYAAWCGHFQAIPQLDKILLGDLWLLHTDWCQMLNCAGIICCGDAEVFALLREYVRVRLRRTPIYESDRDCDRIYDFLPEWAQF